MTDSGMNTHEETAFRALLSQRGVGHVGDRLVEDVNSRLSTTSSATPTPPADTRQQAAEDEAEQPGCCHLGCEQGACESCPCCCAGWCLNGGTDLPEDADDLRLWLEMAREHGSALVPVGERLLAAALASSSPAPPAPARILTDLYRTAFDEWMAEASVDGPRVKFLHGRADAFAEAIRALELPLLAAADVAEEQQP